MTRYLFLTLVLSLAGVLTHRAMLIYLPVLLTLILLFWQTRIPLFAESILFRKKGILCLCALFGVLVLAYPTIINKYEPTKSLIDLYEAKKNKQEGFSARATYKVYPDTTSFISLVRTVVHGFVYYMLKPFPWDIQNSKDVYAFLSSVLRMVLLILSLVAYRRADLPIKKTLGFLLALYLTLAFLWSLGTANYGTSIRHHVTHVWLIVIVGGQYLHRRTPAPSS